MQPNKFSTGKGSTLLFLLLATLLLAVRRTGRPPPGCANPTILRRQACQAQEERILQTTVRILLECWTVQPQETGYDIRYATCHGTVLDGRYLVTHNHFHLPLNIGCDDGASQSYGVVYLFDSSGTWLYKGPLADFETVWAGPATLVLAHHEPGFFTGLGFAGAEFGTWPALPLAVGATVAQVDWDGERTHVDWLTVQNVIIDDDPPRMVLHGSVTPGASGGGVFWNGIHVGNVWRMDEQLNAAGEVVDVVTTAALNTADLFPPAR